MSEAKNIHNSRLELVFEKKIPGLRVSEAKRHQEFIMRTRHVHDTIELFFLIEGRRFVFVDQETYSLEAGMGMLINHSMIHKTSMAAGYPPDHRNFILQLDRSVFDGLLRQLGLPGFDEFGILYGGTTRFKPEEWQLIMAVIDSFKAACEEERSRRENPQDLNAYLLLQAMELLGIFAYRRKAELSGSWKTETGTRVVNTGVHQKVHDIAMYLQNHSAENVTLEETAARFYMSKSYLTRIFRNVTGFSVVEYLTFTRVKKAQIMLRDTDTSVTAIAEAAGFGNITYFEKVFRETAGMTPKQYRKEHARKV